MAHVALTHYDEAMADADAALAVAPEDAQLHESHVLVAYTTDKLDLAVVATTRALELDPNSHSAYF